MCSVAPTRSKFRFARKALGFARKIATIIRWRSALARTPAIRTIRSSVSRGAMVYVLPATGADAVPALSNVAGPCVPRPYDAARPEAELPFASAERPEAAPPLASTARPVAALPPELAALTGTAAASPDIAASPALAVAPPSADPAVAASAGFTAVSAAFASAPPLTDGASPGGSSNTVYSRISCPPGECKSTRKVTTGSVNGSADFSINVGCPCLSRSTTSVVPLRKAGRSSP